MEPAPPVIEERPLSVDPKAAVVKGAPAKKKWSEFEYLIIKDKFTRK